MPAKFEMQVLVTVESTTYGKPTVQQWKSVCQDGKPYQYDTYNEAWDMLCKCYPDAIREEVRVIEVPTRRTVKVTFEDGNTITTDINGTEKTIREYYIGNRFQFGDTEECPKDKLLMATELEFLN